MSSRSHSIRPAIDVTSVAAEIRRRRVWGLALTGTASLALIGMLGLSSGTPPLGLVQLWAIVTGGGAPLARLVVLQLRLPRFVLGSLGGAMLALSGTLLQGTLRNPLAGPELLGVTAGATVVVAAITILHLSVLFILIPWLALAGAVFAGCVIVFAMRSQRDPSTLLLTGAALTALLNASVIILISYGSQMDISLLFLFLVGSLTNRTWLDVQLVLPWAVVTIPFALALARSLNVLQLGDDVARGLGLPLERLRAVILLLAAALVAVVVAVCGPISFVALLVPHVVRRVLRTADARVVLPCSALLGAVLLTGADLLARQLFSPAELPVGIFTALVGGPLLVVLLRSRGRRV